MKKPTLSVPKYQLLHMCVSERRNCIVCEIQCMSVCVKDGTVVACVHVRNTVCVKDGTVLCTKYSGCVCRPVARIFRRGATWMSNLHKHTRLGGSGGTLPREIL